jgi:hypothetical protein
MPLEAPHPFEAAKASLLIATSWAALGCYAWSLTRLALDPAASPAARRIWTAGCVCFFAHMVLAFDVAYDWSHDTAIADIAAQSESISGVRAPWGLFINYAFGLIWLLDLAWWWRVGDLAYRRRPVWSHWLVHGFFLFMLFNGGFVFVERWTRWIGLGLFGVSLWAAIRVPRRHHQWIDPLPKSSS